MNFFERIAGRFTIRGRALSQVDQGMDCANKSESDDAIKYNSSVINSTDSPWDVKAMALFNRALVFTTTQKIIEATQNLKAVLCMPEAKAKIKKSASDKLVRMQRKLDREGTPKSES